MRYEVVKDNLTGNCGIKATVVDTHKEGAFDYWVCECSNVPWAHQIADALNVADEAPLEEPEWINFPTEEGHWWFSGTRYGEPEQVLLHVTVFKTPNGFMLVDGPSFMYKGMFEGKFQRVVLPEPPEQEETP
jgi:hypothetical protein